jgi:hypothetical protein
MENAKDHVRESYAWLTKCCLLGQHFSQQCSIADAVFGTSNSRYGVYGKSISYDGVGGRSNNGYGVYGEGYNNHGVVGVSKPYYGVYGWSESGDGVRGYSNMKFGVYGEGYNNHGVVGVSYTRPIPGLANHAGVYGESHYGYGVRGYSTSGWGVYGSSYEGYGVRGYSDTKTGVYGESPTGAGVYGWTRDGYGLHGYSESEDGYAAYLEGKVYIKGPLEKPAGQFKIDHPLDPANKYLSHSFVESSDMKNVYDGVVALDDKGKAEIHLPDWFSTLNKDFRYQLTAIGAPGPNLYIAEEISDGVTNYSNSNNKVNSSFKVAGGTSGMRVSWQVTGIRKDPWANAHRIKVEEDKPAKERGYYIYPDLYDQPPEKGISHLLFPKEEQWQEQLIK